MQNPATKSVYTTVEFKLSLIWEKNRYKTFKSWPFSSESPCSANKLAESGFYFIGTKDDPDAVRCLFCDKELNGWEEEDDPWEEHLSHSSNCEFAKLKQPEDALTVTQFKEFFEKIVEKEKNIAIESVKEIVDKEFKVKSAALRKLTVVGKKG